MERYKIFAISAALLIAANYCFLVTDNSLVPRLLDYIAYAFFVVGILKSIKT